jgi:phage terminase small subunit
MNRGGRFGPKTALWPRTRAHIFFSRTNISAGIAEMTEKPKAEKDSKAAEIKAPSWLSRAGKLMFRRVARQLNAPETPLSDAQTDLICDYVEARLRIASLAEMLGADIAEASNFNVDKARIIALSRQIDATTLLSHKIADKLGLNGATS